MLNRFAPELPKLRRVLDKLKSLLAHSVPNAEQLWTESYIAVIGDNSTKISGDDARKTLLAIIASDEEPWEFYNMISELIKHLPLATREIVTREIKIPTGYSFEYLQVTSDGHWQIMWEVNPDDDTEYKEVALDWYIPPEQEKAPIVPIAIIDCIASCVLLLRTYLVLPAASVLSIALEATLWDALAAKDIPRSSEQVTYASTKWNLTRKHNKLLVAIEGADRSINELETLVQLGTIFSFESRKAQENNSGSTVELRLEVDKELASFLASDRIEKSVMKTNRGLSAAIQRARSEDVECLRVIPRNYDETLISLRNNLIHLPSHGNLERPIPLPGRGQLETVDDFRKKQSFVNQLLYLVIRVIEIVYTN